MILHNTLYRTSALGLLTMLSFSGCNKVDPVPVDTPLIPIKTEALKAYKSNMMSRPVTIGILNGWKATNGVMLISTPDSLDVIVVKDVSSELTSAQTEDLKNVREKKLTKVLLSCDLYSVDEAAAKELKTRQTAERKSLIATWKGDAVPDEETQSKLLADLEKKVNEEVVAKAIASEKGYVETIYKVVNESGFDGIYVKLPASFGVLSRAHTKDLLGGILSETVEKGKYLAIATPFEDARAEIEKATWVIYDHKVIEHRISAISSEAAAWSNNRYLPMVDLADDTNSAGFLDSKIFSPDGVANRITETIFWTAPNRAGVVFDHIEKVAVYNEQQKTTYVDLKNYINQVALTK